MFYPCPQLRLYFHDGNGHPLVGGKLKTFVSNSTIPIRTVQNSEGTVLNPTEITLDERGECTVFLTAGVIYRFELYDSDGALVLEQDGISVASGSGSGGSSTTIAVESGSDGIDVQQTIMDSGVVIYTISAKKIEDAIEAEKNRAESAESALSKSIADETERAKESEKGLADAIESEKNRAEEAERTISESISKETERAIAAEKASRTEIVAGDNITVEKTVGADGQDVYTVSGESEYNLVDDVRVNGASVVTDKVANIDVPVAGTASPLMDGKASVGNSLKYAREDHVHPSDESKASASHTHGSITNDGKIGSTADLAVVTGTSGAVTTADLTTTSPTVPTGGTTTSIEFIDTVDQDSKGKISATKKAVTVDSTYSSTGTNPVNGKAIAAAIGGLDSNKTSTDGVNVQLKVTETDGKISAVNVTTDNTENKNNKVSEWQTTPDNTHYPSEKLVKDAINAKADGDNSVAIFDGYMRRMNEVTGWRRLAYKQFNFTNTNLNALFRLYLFGSNNRRIGLGDLFINIRFDSSGSAPVFRDCYLMSHRPLDTSIKLKVVGVAGNAVVELWFKPMTFSMLTLTCLGNGYDVTAKAKDWTFGRYLSSSDPEPVEDIANNIYVLSGTVRSVQLNIASPTNGNLVAMDANGLVKDSGIRITSTDVANWNGKQNSLTFDDEPTAGSKNPVTSDGIKKAIDTANAKGITVKEISGEQVICFE